MLTFEKASTMIRRGDSKRLSGVATYLYKRDDDTYAVRYHRTDVVLIHRDGTYTLNSGGWQTATTKARINEYSPARLYQSKHEWYIEGKRPFHDGVKIDSQGRVISASGDPISEVEANPFHPDHVGVN
jgi:hypothetical protein